MPTTGADSGDRALIDQKWLRILAITIAVVAAIARFWTSRQTHALGEDALITLRYAENIAAGRGWTYNPGEHVLGTTTPLFTLILALFAWLHLPAMGCGIALNIVADGVTCYLVARLMARAEIAMPIAGLFAALLYALSSTPISISISGMETALVTCAGMAAVHAYVAGRPRALCACGAVLFLLRIDGLLLFTLLFAAYTIQRRQIPWTAVGLFAMAIAPWLIFAALYFGSPVPSSVVAKLTVYSHTTWTPGSFTDTVAFNREAIRNQFTLGWPQRIVTVLFLIGAATIVSAMARRKAGKPSDSTAAGFGANAGVLLAPLLWLILYYGTMLVSHVPAFPWYFLPPWPLFICIALIGAGTLWNRAVVWQGAAGPGNRTSRAFVGAALFVFGLFGAVHLRSIARDIAAAQSREDTLRRPLGLWLRAHVAPGERVLMEPIGYAGYYSGRRILDMVGLVSPEVLPYYRTPHALSGIVQGLMPEWLCLRASERDLLHEQAPLLPDSEYVLVQVFPSAEDPVFYLYHRRL